MQLPFHLEVHDDVRRIEVLVVGLQLDAELLLRFGGRGDEDELGAPMVEETGRVDRDGTTVLKRFFSFFRKRTFCTLRVAPDRRKGTWKSGRRPMQYVQGEDIEKLSIEELRADGLAAAVSRPA